MKNIAICLLICICGFVCACAKQGVGINKTINEDSGFVPFFVYDDFGSQNNHYVPTGWMGDVADLKMDMACTTVKYRGNYSIKIVYAPNQKAIKQWVGVYWQNPANNWGDKKGGYNLTGAKKIVFFAKGERGNEVLSEVKIGGISGVFADTDVAWIKNIKLTNEWKEYKINVSESDLSSIAGGFCVVFSKKDNPGGCTVYLDEIRYE